MNRLLISLSRSPQVRAFPMRRTGVSRDDVAHRLDDAMSRNVDLSSGRIMGSMCCSPHPLAVEAHMRFVESNLGKPGLCEGTLELESEVIKMLGNLVNLPDPYGHFLSGATEANITAMYIARKITGRRKVIFPRSAHFSVHKAINLMNMEPVKIGLDGDHRLSLDDLEGSLDDDVAMVFTVAGTTELGTVDPIRRIGEMISDVPIHVDAAFGGFVLPFLEEMGRLEERFMGWDFSVEEVSTMAIDPHKMGLATIPSGALLKRQGLDRGTLAVPSPYLTMPISYTLSGTRASGAVAGAYAVMSHLGREGYVKVVRSVMDETTYLKKRLQELSLDPVIDPVMNILAVHHHDPISVQERMRERGWFISRMEDPKALRFVIMPQVLRGALDDMLGDLEEVLRAV